jgi:hypothetical protein
VMHRNLRGSLKPHIQQHGAIGVRRNCRGGVISPK